VVIILYNSHIITKQQLEYQMLQAIYPTKKALKESIGKRLNYRETSIFGIEYVPTGKFCVADGGPARKWFAEVWMDNGLIAKVK
jgi:hypothetical protein